jgi:integrase
MMTFGEYVRYFEESILALGKTSSIKSMKSRLRKCTEAFGDKDLPLSSMDVQRFVTQLSQKYPPQTTSNIWGAMRAVLTRAKSDGLITEVPKPILPKIEKIEQEWFKPEEMKLLSRYEPLYAVASETGARIGELLAIQIQDIDFENQTLHIRRNVYDRVLSAPKTKAGNRPLSFSRWLYQILKREVGTRPAEEFLFPDDKGTTRNSDTETRKLYHACKVFGIAPAGFHAFRRGNATLQASIIGVPEKLIAFRLGHANLGLTLGRYAKYLVGMDREAAEQIGELLK